MTSRRTQGKPQLRVRRPLRRPRRPIMALARGGHHHGRMSKVQFHEPEIDKIARVMAAGAGVVWDRLDHYPGYMRGFWRNEARCLLDRMSRNDLDRAA